MFEEFAIGLDETTVGRELRRLGYRKLIDQPWCIISLGLRDWAHG